MQEAIKTALRRGEKTITNGEKARIRNAGFQ